MPILNLVNFKIKVLLVIKNCPFDYPKTLSPNHEPIMYPINTINVASKITIHAFKKALPSTISSN